MAEFKLTPQQQRIVDHRGGTLLVSAAAGSGKTKVLVDRLMGYLCDETDPANIDSFLLITYTKAAAAEMRGKIAAALSARLAEEPENRHLQRQLIRLHAAQISTVHAFCTQLLREYAHCLGLAADFRVLEQNQAEALKQQVLEQTLELAYNNVDENPAREELFDTLGAGRDDRSLSALLLTLYEQVRCHPDPEAWMQKSVQNLQVEEVEDAAQTYWGTFLLAEYKKAVERSCRELRQACDEMMGDDVLTEAYLPTYLENIESVSSMLSLSTWDEIFEYGVPDKGRLKSVRKYEDKAFLVRIQQRRKNAFARLEKALKPFASPSCDVLEDLQLSAASLTELFVVLREFMHNYDLEKQRQHTMDFSDLEHYSLKLLRRVDGSPTPEAQQVSLRFREIMVDEYQDSNEVQDAIFRAISKNGENCFFVGDVKQSIYRFRLADPGIFLQKYHDFPTKEEVSVPSGSKLLLSRNFRSRPQILQAVNDVFCGVMSEQVGEIDYTEDEQLQPGRQVLPLQGPEVELHCISTDNGDEQAPVKAEAEAAFVASRIAQMLNQGECVEDGGEIRPIRAEDIVILLRSVRSTAPVYLSALWSAGIPVSYEQSGDLMDTLEVQLLYCMLQVIDNPRQDIPLAAVLLSPVYGFSASDLAMVRRHGKMMRLYDALLRCDEMEKAQLFISQLNALRELRPSLPLADFCWEVLRRMQLENLLRAMPDGARRLSNPDACLQYLQGSAESLSQAINRMEQMGEAIAAPGQDPAGGVKIMSIHSSKGLEFPVVFLCDLSKRFNLEDMKQQVLTHPKHGVASVAVDSVRRVRYPTIAKLAMAKCKEDEAKSEELRVLYVAMTRARERLIMTYCAAKLDSILERLSQDAMYPVPPEQAIEASCAGDWVLMAALTRMDAGALHLQSRPAELRIPLSPWRIEYHTAAPTEAVQTEDEITAVAPAWPDSDTLINVLDSHYAFDGSTVVPMKLTATQLKGRDLDEELTDAPELLPEHKRIKFPLPDFSQAGELSAAERGTAMHLFMQFADYSRCADPAGVEEECSRLLSQQFLTEQQCEAVDRGKIWAFFASELGQQVLSSSHLIREFKFSVLERAQKYYPDTAGDEVLLQGVVDCCLDEPDGLIVLDFKTDRVQPGGELSRGEYYRGQLRAYADALERIFEKPVKRRIVYFFATGTPVEV